MKNLVLEKNLVLTFYLFMYEYLCYYLGYYSYSIHKYPRNIIIMSSKYNFPQYILPPYALVSAGLGLYGISNDH